MNPIRIHLGSMPEMLRAIITDLLHQDPAIVVVGRSSQGEDELQCAREEWADVLITQDRRHDGNVFLDALLSAPPICIFAISDDGRSADAVNLFRQPVALNERRPSALANAVRQIAGHRRGRDSPHTKLLRPHIREEPVAVMRQEAVPRNKLNEVADQRCGFIRGR